jgi:sensor histidine kinase YesM
MKRFVEITFNIVFWIISIWVILQIVGLSLEEVEIIVEEGQETVIEMEVNLSPYFYYGMSLKVLLFYFVVFYLIPKTKPLWRLFAVLLAILVLLFVIEILPLQLFYGELDMNYVISILGLYGFYTAVSVAYGLIRNQIKTEQTAQLLANEKLQTELKLLRSQINPHFLFNALNNLLAISEQSKNPAISSGITQLSELLRFLIYDAQTDYIPLSKEVEFIESFIALQQLRYASSKEVDVELNVIGVQENHQIAPALLIPFVENAFKHGVKYDTASFIHIFIEVKNDELSFTIENPKPKKTLTELDKKYSGVGLENVKKRLALRYQERYQLSIQHEEKTFKVYLKIKL